MILVQMIRSVFTELIFCNCLVSHFSNCKFIRYWFIKLEFHVYNSFIVSLIFSCLNVFCSLCISRRLTDQLNLRLNIMKELSIGKQRAVNLMVDMPLFDCKRFLYGK